MIHLLEAISTRRYRQAMIETQLETRIVGVDAGIDAARAEITAGRPVAVPTETVYGLAADATNGAAVAAIYLAKGRPSFNPLISHVANFAMAQRFGIFDADLARLAETFWPGPLTLVVPLAKNAPVHALALAGLETIALRVPLGVLAELSRVLDRPLAAPSANRSGALSPTSAEAVKQSLEGRLGLILDGGPTQIGVESTIIGRVNGRLTLLRPGGITVEAIKAATGLSVERIEKRHANHLDADKSAGAPIAPGMLASHYAPNAPVRLNAHSVKAGEALLSFGNAPILGSPKATLNLSANADMSEAAQNLFAFLHRLDAAKPTAIAVSPIPLHGLGEAINDRLERAAAPRSTVYQD
jgi:L-threonylcarbamoyladenylate synthase